jgi:hypothetical protein
MAITPKLGELPTDRTVTADELIQRSVLRPCGLLSDPPTLTR